MPKPYPSVIFAKSERNSRVSPPFYRLLLQMPLIFPSLKWRNKQLSVMDNTRQAKTYQVKYQLIR